MIKNRRRQRLRSEFMLFNTPDFLYSERYEALNLSWVISTFLKRG